MATKRRIPSNISESELTDSQGWSVEGMLNADGGGRSAPSWDQDLMYLYTHEIGTIPLLTATQEEEIGRRIEEGQIEIRRLLAKIPLALRILLRLADQVRRGQRSLDRLLLFPDGSQPKPDEFGGLLACFDQIRAHYRDMVNGCKRLKAGGLSAPVASAYRRRIARNRADIQNIVAHLPLRPDGLDRLLADVRRLRTRIQGLHSEAFDPGKGVRDAKSVRKLETRIGLSHRRFLSVLHRIDEKDRAARGAKHRFIRANLRLVVWVARRYQGRGLSLIELVQEGNLGLMRAVDRFQYRRGLRFANYATWWIRHQILRAIAHHARTIRIPVYMLERLHRLMRVNRALVNELGRVATPEELAHRAGISPAEVQLILDLTRRQVSSETLIAEELTLADSLKDEQIPLPDEAVVAANMTVHIQRALASLSPREQDILRLRFGIGGGDEHTLEEIASRFSLSRERIRQIEASALLKLRTSVFGDVLKTFVEN